LSLAPIGRQKALKESTFEIHNAYCSRINVEQASAASKPSSAACLRYARRAQDILVSSAVRRRRSAGTGNGFGDGDGVAAYRTQDCKRTARRGEPNRTAAWSTASNGALQDAPTHKNPTSPPTLLPRIVNELPVSIRHEKTK